MFHPHQAHHELPHLVENSVILSNHHAGHLMAKYSHTNVTPKLPHAFKGFSLNIHYSFNPWSLPIYLIYSPVVHSQESTTLSSKFGNLELSGAACTADSD